MSSSFYVVVASDASIDQYPENTPSSFKMQLPSQLHLSEDLGSGHDAYYLPTYLGKYTQQSGILSFTLQW